MTDQAIVWIGSVYCDGCNAELPVNELGIGVAKFWKAYPVPATVQFARAPLCHPACGGRIILSQAPAPDPGCVDCLIDARRVHLG
jgi:hypothetical protein